MFPYTHTHSLSLSLSRFLSFGAIRRSPFACKLTSHDWSLCDAIQPILNARKADSSARAPSTIRTATLDGITGTFVRLHAKGLRGIDAAPETRENMSMYTETSSAPVHEGR